MHPSFIWGTILILLGSALILKSIFQITIPLIRPFLGCVLVYFGLSIMMDPFSESPEKKTVLFGYSQLAGQQAIKQYNVIFSSAVIDLSELPITQETEIVFNVVLGSGKLILNPNIPTKVRVNALVARASLPDETLLSFGRNVYKNVDTEPMLNIQAHAVFANLEVVMAEPKPVDNQVTVQEIALAQQEA